MYMSILFQISELGGEILLYARIIWIETPHLRGIYELGATWDADSDGGRSHSDFEL